MSSTNIIRANGVDFAILEEGSGPLVLLLHGFPDTAHSWDATRPAVAAAGFRAVSPFLRGYAPSSIPADGDYSTDTLGDDIAALIEALGETSAIVVGHDWGASAAYSAAITHPDRVVKLFTVAIPHPMSIPRTPWLLWKGRHFLSLRRAGAAERVRRDNFAEIDMLVHRWSPAWDVPVGETDAVKRAFSEPGCLEAALGYYRAVGLRLPKSYRGRIAMPAVAFAGETDFALGPRAFERARKLHDSDYEVVALPGGHFMHREHPEQFIEALIERLPSR
jgi:pimeloyl-ACP methyl ester carboxylesterase